MRVVANPAADGPELVQVRESLERGELVVVPTDTVYGIAALACDEAAVARLYAAKGRPAGQSTAVIFGSVAALVDALSDLDVRSSWAVHSLLPGPWTLILDNPSGRWPWLTGGVPGPLGVRVPAGALNLPAIAATSANPAGRPTAATVAEVDENLQSHLSIAVDRGPRPAGSESTVLDLVAWSRGEGDVNVLRDPVGRAGQALAVLGDAP